MQAETCTFPMFANQGSAPDITCAHTLAPPQGTGSGRYPRLAFVAAKKVVDTGRSLSPAEAGGRHDEVGVAPVGQSLGRLVLPRTWSIGTAAHRWWRKAWRFRMTQSGCGCDHGTPPPTRVPAAILCAIPGARPQITATRR